MPPTAKFSKEKIVEAALDIVRTEGFDALTARALGTKLGSSAARRGRFLQYFPTWKKYSSPSRKLPKCFIKNMSARDYRKVLLLKGLEPSIFYSP